MIGVVADPTEHAVVREFFELFKTPWGFYRSGTQYEVLLCSGDLPFDKNTARLILIYSSKAIAIGASERVEGSASKGGTVLVHKGCRIPIYGDYITFGEHGLDVLFRDDDSRVSAICQEESPHGLIVQIGYDLFREVEILLTTGQPAAYASMPTLDLHIALLRELIVANGTRLVEIPPVPDGHGFIACLTHDVDHPSIRRHKWDHTVFGFLHRAIFGSLVNLFRGWISTRDLLRNWASALKLPFIYLGLAKDFWNDFDDRYLALEKGLRSTYFVIPFKDYSGKIPQGIAPSFRASRYGAQDIASAIRKILAAECEIGLHGIDAWLDNAKGKEELDEIQRVTGRATIGVRMHWLYYDQQSASLLEDIGVVYDSTAGYKETVGYYAGTAQVYKPLRVTKLLELPMHVMDTALFYPAYMGLSQLQAKKVVEGLIKHVRLSGGCITTNWHDRSLAPERLWGASYRDLVQDLKDHDAWFATAGQAVSWFQKRRSAAFMEGSDPGSVRAQITAPHDDLPGLRLRVHNAREFCKASETSSDEWLDFAFDGSVGSQLICEVGN